MKIAFVVSHKPAAREAYRTLTRRYGDAPLSQADYVVAVGGDGTTLKALSATMLAGPKPVFSLRAAGSIGFLGNAWRPDDLPRRLEEADALELHPLRADIWQRDAGKQVLFGLNEIVVIRESLQSAKLQLALAKQSEASLIGDGLVVATPVGSTATISRSGGHDCMWDQGCLRSRGYRFDTDRDG